MVNNFIFLGLVPGTNFQITFYDLLVFADVVAGLIIIFKLRHLSRGIKRLRFVLTVPRGTQLTLL